MSSEVLDILKRHVLGQQVGDHEHAEAVRGGALTGRPAAAKRRFSILRIMSVPNGRPEIGRSSVLVQMTIRSISSTVTVSAVRS